MLLKIPIFNFPTYSLTQILQYIREQHINRWEMVSAL